MGGRGGGNNNLFEPFYDSLRIAGPIMMQQKQLDAQKQRADQAFLMQKQKLLQEAEQAQRDVEVKTTLEMFKGAMESVNPEDPESVFRAKAVASQLEKFGIPFPKDETGDLILPGLTWAKPTKPKEQYDIKDTDQGLMFIPKDPNSGLQAKPTGFNAPLKKWEAQPATTGGRQPSQPQPKIPMGYEPNPSGEGLRPIPGGPADKPQRGEQGTKPQQGYMWNDDKSAQVPIPGTPAHQKLKTTFAKEKYAFETVTYDLDRMEKEAEAILASKGLGGITGISGKFPNIPGGDAANAEARLKTLKSQTFVTALSNMRKASTTGAAVGNVTEKEGDKLEANIASLEKSQSFEEMQAALKRIIEYTKNTKEKLRNAFSTWDDMMNPGGGAPVSTKNLDLQSVPEDELKKKLGISQ